MKKLHDISKVYVFSPWGKTTGGIELLHQLVDYLRNRQLEAYIYYYENPFARIPEVYNKYNIVTATQVDDAFGSVLVLPEICFHVSAYYKASQIVLWWLSVDNYYHREKKHIPLYEIYSYSKIYGMKQLWHRLMRLFKLQWTVKPAFSIKKAIEKAYIHAYQSEYANLHLQHRGVVELYPLKDYINTAFVSESACQKREPNILYNPKKGIKFTRKLIKVAPDLKFIPLQNLSRAELQYLFATSMLYIDFGNHPGMDRLPREAAVNGCCIITGMQGAAANEVDISIPCSYKFDESETSVEVIIRRIREVLTDYDSHSKAFEPYKRRIMGETREFYRQIDELFQLR